MNPGPGGDGNDPMMQHRAKYQRSQKTRAIAAVIGTLSLVAVIAVVVVVLNLPEGASGEPENEAASESKSKPETADYPSEGDFLVTHLETGSCLTSGPEPGNKDREVTVLGDCDDPYPKVLTFKPEDGHVYTVEMDFTKKDWQACWTVDQPADDEGYLTAGQDCGGENRHRQRIELTMGADDAAVMSLPGTGYCLGPFQYKSEAGQAIATVDCHSHKSEQLFKLTPV